MLRGSIRLFRIRGIQLSVHFTFLLLLGYVAWEGWRVERASGAVGNILTMLVFFTCVVLHELGHAFAAKSFRVVVPRILLLPIGGMAEFSSMPRRPAHEILIALAGPAVNFAIVLLLSLFIQWPSGTQVLSMELSDLQLLLIINLTMGCFNLIPVFPMDGGRVLRAVLAQHLPYLDATRWAADGGKLLALLGIVLAVALPAQPHLLTAALFGFIIIAGELEYRAVRREEGWCPTQKNGPLPRSILHTNIAASPPSVGCLRSVDTPRR